MADWGNTDNVNSGWNDVSGGASATQDWGPTPSAADFPTGDHDPFGANANGHESFDANPAGANDFGSAEGGFGGDEGPSPITCNECGKEGHIRRECPDRPAMTCRGCGEEGHIRKECPNKPPDLCRNCGEEGHVIAACTNPRKIDRSHIEDVSPEVAWEEMKEAVSDRDVFEFKEALAKYLKKFPEMTFIAIEEWLRGQNLNIYVIAVEREVMPTMTLMDLQGNLGKKWCIQYSFSPKPDRPRDVEGWPQSAEDNLQRLVDAGEPVPTGIPRCLNCKEIGHIAKECEVERTEADKPGIRCFNCDGEGHRMRDCPNPRKDKFACKNCNKPGHKAADCTEPRSAENVECNKCHEMGHFAKDCTKPREIQCRNCDEFGHMSRECPQPFSPAKIKCNNCGELGHKKLQCPNPTADDIDDFGGQPADMDNTGDFGNANNSGDTGGGWDHGAAADAATGGGGWDFGSAPTAADGGGW